LDKKTPLEFAKYFECDSIITILMKATKDWPKSHSLLPKHIQISIKEILCVLKKFYKIPKELNIIIVVKILYLSDF